MSCLSVSVTRRYCISVAKRRITQTTPYDSPGTLVFWRQQSLVGDPFPLKFVLSDPPPFHKPRFWPISANSASAVRAGERVQLALIGSRPCAFQPALNEPCMLPLSPTPNPQKGGTKSDSAVFASKIQLLLKNFCYRVSLCENIQWQSCSYIIPLSNGP